MDYGAKRIQAGVNEVRNTPFEPCSRAQRLPATLPSAARVPDERLPRRGTVTARTVAAGTYTSFH
jgi:hypothetical protein